MLSYNENPPPSLLYGASDPPRWHSSVLQFLYFLSSAWDAFSPNDSLPSAYFYIRGHFSSESWRYSSVIPGFACLCWEIQHLDLSSFSLSSHLFLFAPCILKLPQHVGERHISPEPISINICWVMPGWKDGWTDGWMHKLVPGCMVNDCYGQSPVLQLPRGGRTTESSSWLQGWAQLFLASYSLRHKGSQSGVSGPLDGL